MRSYSYKTNPYVHQKKALELSLRQKYFAALMEMGTGKTKWAIDEMGILYCQELIDAAVVAAPKGVYANWTKKEFPTHLSDDLTKETMIYRWQGLSTKAEKQMAEAILKWKGFAILVINVEALSSSQKAYDYLARFMKARRVAFYIDESTLIKNHSSSRSKNLTKLALPAEYRRIMTGSPVTKSPLDFFSQFNFLNKGLIGPPSFYGFRAKYAILVNKVFGGRSVAVVDGYQNLEDLTERVKRYSYRVLKEECLDLPPKIFERREVELTDEQTRYYAAMREEAFVEIGESNFASATIVLTQLMRLHQIVCGHITDADGNTVVIPSKRLDALCETIDEMTGKVIIWARYRHDLRAIVQRLRQEHGNDAVVQYWGGVEKGEREDAVRRFEEDDDCRFFVSNQSTGGYGITLVAASNVIYYSNDYDLEKRLQSEDRAHRSGQTKSVLYVDLVAPGTVDEKIIDALRAKKNIADMVTGDGYRAWL